MSEKACPLDPAMDRALRQAVRRKEMEQWLGRRPETKGRKVIRIGRPDPGMPIIIHGEDEGEKTSNHTAEDTEPELKLKVLETVNAAAKRGFATRLGDVYAREEVK